jgi:TetR/AcrR family transcriptional regulator, transcriptional repressor of aconitase
VPKVSKEYSAARRQQIIDAAYRCFARNGFHQTTMRDIYEEANLSPGAVYHYFDSKDEIIQASFVFDYERSQDVFSAARESAEPMRALAELLDFFFQGLKEAATLGSGRVNVQGWGEALVNPQLGRNLRGVLDKYLTALAPIVAGAQEAGQLDRSLDPVAMSRLLLSIYYGLELQAALDPELDVDKYAAAATALLRAAAPRSEPAKPTD